MIRWVLFVKSGKVTRSPQKRSGHSSRVPNKFQLDILRSLTGMDSLWIEFMTFEELFFSIYSENLPILGEFFLTI